MKRQTIVVPRWSMTRWPDEYERVDQETIDAVLIGAWAVHRAIEGRGWTVTLASYLKRRRHVPALKALQKLQGGR